MSTSPLNHSAPLGAKAVTVYEEDGVTPIPFSTLANQAADENVGHNPDFRPSSGRSREEDNLIGKGANPSADVVTKNHTTIDPVHGEASPAVDGETVVESVPAVLPEGSVVTEPSVEVKVVSGTKVVASEPAPVVLSPEEIEAERVAAEEREEKYHAERAEAEKPAEDAADKA